jgi:hypothetical protein
VVEIFKTVTIFYAVIPAILIAALLLVGVMVSIARALGFR